jgi:hypothetical protein
VLARHEYLMVAYVDDISQTGFRSKKRRSHGVQSSAAISLIARCAMGSASVVHKPHAPLIGAARAIACSRFENTGPSAREDGFQLRHRFCARLYARTQRAGDDPVRDDRDLAQQRAVSLQARQPPRRITLAALPQG